MWPVSGWWHRPPVETTIELLQAPCFQPGEGQGKHGFLAIAIETAYLSDSVPKKNQALGFILLQHEQLVGNKRNTSMLIEKSLTLLIAKKGKISIFG